MIREETTNVTDTVVQGQELPTHESLLLPRKFKASSFVDGRSPPRLVALED